MKTKFYYIRDTKQAPIITVCLIQNNNQFYRGIAVCSERDNPTKLIGKEIAFSRAVAAYEDGTDDCIFDISSLFSVNKRITERLRILIINRMFYLQDSKPTLTERERRIFVNVWLFD